jgi:GAF domain-containing protein
MTFPSEGSAPGIDSALETLLSIGAQGQDAAALRLLVELGLQLVDADEGSLLLRDPDSDELVFSLVVGAEGSALVGQRVPLGKGLTGLAALTQAVQIGAPTWVVGAESQGGEDPRAVIAAPLIVRDHCVGVLTAVSFREGRRFHGADANAYGRIAAIAAVLVQQRRGLDAATRGQDTFEGGDPSLERRIVGSLLRIAARSRSSLERVATILESVEALVCDEEP